jgi:hypothetical protein
VTTRPSLGDRIPTSGDPDDVIDAFVGWVGDLGLDLYPAQEEALLEVVAGSHVIVNTPTGSGKSLIAIGAHLAAVAAGGRTFYTAPIKALVSEKFFDLTATFGADRVGMMTGDASVNAGAPIICCTAEILANIALREGLAAPVSQVVMDEFHSIADPDRGWAWQVPLLELTDAQHVLMSATLGDVSRFEEGLRRRTGREVAVVRSATRPVPLVHEFRTVPLVETLEELLATGGAPVYVVHPTQAGAVERAQALMSLKLCTREEKDAIADLIGDFRFAAGFGRTLARYVRNGIGVHHAGMLPKYRRLVERLAQAGLLKVICGTDTLGVGINVPIRTVLLTSLSKFDGTTTRLLTAREFHQIGGRAGRAGFDTMGNVVVMAPEHAIENARAEAKAQARSAADGKRRKVVKKKPPEGMVSWGEPTFTRLVGAEPEPLTTSLRVTHSMVMNVLDRPGDGRAALRHLLEGSDEPPARVEEHLARAAEIEQALIAAGVVEVLDQPDEKGRTVRVTVELQADFALDQPLAPFALAALDLLDPDSEDHALDVVSVVESVVEDPRPVLAAQLRRARDEAMSAMKAQGLDYDQRMAELDLITAPRPLADLLQPAFAAYREGHPWLAEHPLRPKAVVREVYELAMGFADYVRHHQLARSEGLLLRYLSDVYKALVRTVPEDAKTEELVDVTEWLGEMVRQVDSSLLDEWEALRHPDALVAPDDRPVDHAPPPVTANRRAFTVLVRNALFHRVELAAARRWTALGELDDEGGWDADRWHAALAPYFAEHDSIGIDADARSASMVTIAPGPERWTVDQVLADPDGTGEWRITAEVDVAASDAEGAPVVRVTGVGPFDAVVGAGAGEP